MAFGALVGTNNSSMGLPRADAHLVTYQNKV